MKACIGGVNLELSPGVPVLEQTSLNGFRDFLVGLAAPDISITPGELQEFRAPPGQPDFESPGLWHLWHNNGSPVLQIGIASASFLALELSPDFRHGKLFLSPGSGSVSAQDFQALLKLLLVNYLAQQGLGVFLHACAVKEAGRVYLFAGSSGCGKSTMASLWSRVPGAVVLSDERVILRCRAGRFWAYGTPWSSSAGAASPQCAPLAKVFLLKHRSENESFRLSGAQAARRLLAHAWLTFWDAAGLDFGLQFLEELVGSVPVHELGFVPDRRVVDFIRWAS